MKDFIQIPCPLCQSVKSRVRYTTRDYNRGYPGAFTYVECAGCGLVYENPRPQPENIWEWYPAYYGTGPPINLIDAENKINVPVHSFRAKFIEKHFAHGTLLDIGCGSGYFLEYMRRRGWNVRGVEPAPELVDYARTRLGLTDVQAASWPLPGENPVKADVVTLFHVLEHFVSPVKALLAAHNVLTPAGLLVIETPNIESWPARIFGDRYLSLEAPRHLVLFSGKTLQKTVELAGFQILQARSFSPSTMDYSESLRYFLRDKGLGRCPNRCFDIAGKQEQVAGGPGAQSKRLKAGLIGRTAINAIHGFENTIYSALNKVADYSGSGCNLLLAARRCEKG